MSLHEDVTVAIHQEIESLGSAVALSPTTVAIAVQRRFCDTPIQPHLQYTSLEHIKQLARRELSGRYSTEADDSVAHQAEMFSGVLQDRYPVPKRANEDPIYKLLGDLSDEEARWNVQQLRKSARARLEHADALEAWVEGRVAQAA